MSVKVMSDKEKQLLLQVLCEMLPHGVKVRGVFLNYNKDKDRILYEECDNDMDWQDLRRYETLKPYLRPLSSMTDEEKETYEMFFNEDGLLNTSVDVYLDWLLENHFDYRGLIRMGIALPAPEGMYK